MFILNKGFVKKTTCSFEMLHNCIKHNVIKTRWLEDIGFYKTNALSLRLLMSFVVVSSVKDEGREEEREVRQENPNGDSKFPWFKLEC